MIAFVMAGDASAQRVPVGRERQQLDWSQPGIAPRIQLKDGRPAPVVQTPKDRRPAKRRKCKSRRC